MSLSSAIENSPVLDKNRHARLIEDIDHVCSVANIPKELISQSAKDSLSPVELNWVKNFRVFQTQGKGLLLTKKHDPSPHIKMQAMTAAFLRNFIDARVMSVNTVLDVLEEGDDINATVLMIPNFYVQLAQGRMLPTFKISRMFDMLLTRSSQGRINVLYASSLSEAGKEYGHLFEDLLSTYEQSVGD